MNSFEETFKELDELLEEGTPALMHLHFIILTDFGPLGAQPKVCAGVSTKPLLPRLVHP